MEAVEAGNELDLLAQIESSWVFELSPLLVAILLKKGLQSLCW